MAPRIINLFQFIHSRDDQLKRIASLVAEELRAQTNQDHSIFVHLVESIKEEFNRFTQQFQGFSVEQANCYMCSEPYPQDCAILKGRTRVYSIH